MGNPTTSLQNVTAPRSATRSTRRKPTAKRPSGLQLLLYFARRHPFITLFAVWIAFLFFGWLAIKGLMYINPAPLEVVESPPPVAESPTHSADSSHVVGLLILVVATCTTSSILISRRLRGAQASPRRIVKRQAPPGSNSRRTASSSKRSPSKQAPRPHQAVSESAAPSKPANSTPFDAIAKIPTRSATIAQLADRENSTTKQPTLAERLAIRQPERKS